MANQTGRPIAPARKLVAAVMGTLAVFVIVFGLGMSSMPVAFFGGVVLLLAIALALVPVSGRRGGRATVAGNAEVVAIPPAPVSAAYGRADIEAIVVAPGLGTFETVIRESRIPVAKWPVPGATVPITVDVDDTRRVRVNWNDAALRDEGADPPPPPPPAAVDDDQFDDEVLGSVDPAPWEGRDRDWAFDPDEPPPPPGPRAAADFADTRTTTPVVVRDTPTGTIVEGHVVGADEEPAPLPRRAPGAGHFATADPAADTADDLPEDPPPPPPPASPGGGTPAGGPSTSSYAASGSPAGPPASDPYSSSPSAGPSYAAGSSGSSYAGSSGSEPSAGPSTSGSSTSGAFVAGPGGTTAPSARAYSGPGSGRAPGTRPSPKRRGSGATATVEREDPTADAPAPDRDVPASTTATATTATTTATGRPPAQRPPAESESTPADPDAAPIDFPLDEPARPARPADATTAWAPTGAGDSSSPTRDSSSPTRDSSSPTRDDSSPSGGSSGAGAFVAGAAAGATAAAAKSAWDNRSADKSSATDPATEADTVAWPATGPGAPASAAAAAQTDPPDESEPGRTRFYSQPDEVTEQLMADQAGRPEPTPTSFRPVPRPEPMPSSSAPSPVSAPPEAPEPDRPFPSAPQPESPHPATIDDIDIPLDEPATPPAAAATPAPAPEPVPVAVPVEDPIDIPLSGNPEPAPESKPAATRAMADGVLAPPAAEVPDDVAEPLPITTFTEDAIPAAAVPVAAPSTAGPSHSSEPDLEPQKPSPEAPSSSDDDRHAVIAEPVTEPSTPSSGSGGTRLAAAAAGVAAAAAAVVGAVRRKDSDKSESDTEPATPARSEAAAPGPDAEAAGRQAATGAEPAATPAAGNPWGDFGGNSEPDEHAGDLITAYPSARPGPAGAIHGVGITVLVTNLDRSIEFYRDVLGFFEIDSGDGSAVLASGDTRLVLRTVHNLASEAGRLISLNLEVGDVQAVYDELREKGVKFVHTPRATNRGDKLELWSATFRDPDNHNIAITQWRAIR